MRHKTSDIESTRKDEEPARRSMIRGISNSIIMLAVALSLMISTTPSVFATSAYDSTVNPLSDLKYNDANENVISIASTWRTHMYNACGSTIYNDFTEALNGGRYAVTQEGTDDDYGVTVIWSKAGDVTTASFATANTNLKYLATDAGWQGKARFYFNSTTDQDVCGYSSVAFNNPWGNTLDMEADGSQLGIYASTFSTNDISDYGGSTVPSGPGIEPIHGNVQCVNTSNVISAVHINVQSGIDGNAIINDDGIGGKNYAYYPTEDSEYALIVLCDGDPFYGPTVSTGLYDSYNWYCTPTGGLNVCAAG